MREHFDDTELERLVLSISKLGILQDLITEQEGKNVRVHAGHRRLVVAQALGLPTVPCRIYPAGKVPGVAVMVAENAAREEVNPAHEARKFGRLLETECGGDVDQLAALTYETREYCDGRLQLLRGDSRILDALSDSVIKLGVAQELNKVKNEALRLMFLDSAIRGGATVRVVRDWRVSAELAEAHGVTEALPLPLMGAAVQEVPVFRMICLLCDHDDSPHDMELVYMHKGCRRIILDRWLDTVKGGPAAG